MNRDDLMLKLAKSCGFCFGVRNALKIVEDLLKQKEKVITFGNIIHNPQVVLNLKKKGVFVIENLKDFVRGSVLVIRSHGVSLNIYRELKRLGIRFYDATCPFVKRIHKKVFEAFRKDKIVLIAGDFSHPEVVGIRGYCEKSFVFSNIEELKKLFEEEKLQKKEILVVAQTTFSQKIWKEAVFYIEACCENFKIFDSICFSTKERQKEAEEKSKQCDFAVVVGGRNSSNTRKLFEICNRNCKTYHIENVLEIEKLDCDFKDKEVFLTAGASTPDSVIKTVFDKITEII